MGLRSGLPNLGPPRCRVAALAAPIQLAPAAQQSTIKSAHQPPRSNRGQPVEAPQLAGGVTPWETLDRIAARIQDYGWHVQLQLDGRSLPEREAQIRSWPAASLS